MAWLETLSRGKTGGVAVERRGQADGGVVEGIALDDAAFSPAAEAGGGAHSEGGGEDVAAAEDETEAIIGAGVARTGDVVSAEEGGGVGLHLALLGPTAEDAGGVGEVVVDADEVFVGGGGGGGGGGEVVRDAAVDGVGVEAGELGADGVDAGGGDDVAGKGIADEAGAGGDAAGGGVKLAGGDLTAGVGVVDGAGKDGAAEEVDRGRAVGDDLRPEEGGEVAGAEGGSGDGAGEVGRSALAQTFVETEDEGFVFALVEAGDDEGAAGGDAELIAAEGRLGEAVEVVEVGVGVELVVAEELVG